MCGIAGILRFDGRAIQPEELSLILDKLKHRGHDSSGLAIGTANTRGYVQMSKYAGIGLAHRRLAIIDLSVTAAQPMSYAENRLWLTYNGEIYNYIELRTELEKFGYKFRTHSDTEVILAAYQHWGDSCVKHFNGMFSFALWDEDRGRLFCARDPIGIKPFYYVLTPNFFVFASESSALVHLTGKSLNRDAIAAYLFCMYVPGPWSIFEGIHKLKPGYTLTVTSDGQVDFNRFWQINEFENVKDSPIQRLKIKELLSAALHRQLRSDVPVGVLLSGGIDSSMIVALAADRTSELHTFSVGYEGHYINELPYARQVAERYGTCHHELYLKASDEIANLNKALAAMNEPIADSAILPSFMLCEMAAAEGVKVLLNGIGGDEVFGGYDRYIENSMRRRLFEAIPYGLRIWFSYLLPLRYSELRARFRYLGFDLMSGTGGCLSLFLNIFSSNKDFASFIKRLAQDCFPPVRKGLSSVYNKMLFDLQVYIPDELLILLDQMTMAWTIEGRVPFLDIDVTSESFRFPARSHVMAGRTKSLLREISIPYLGTELAQRKKQGFGGPVPFWVKQNAQEMLEVVSSIRRIPYFETFDVNQYVHCGHVKELNNTEALEIFYLYCFARWHERLKSL